MLSESQYLDIFGDNGSGNSDSDRGLQELRESLGSDEKLADDLESGETWGDDVFIYLPIDESLSESRKKGGDAEELENNRTYDYLTKHHHDGGTRFTRQEVMNAATRWKLDGDALLVKNFHEDEYRKATDAEIKELLDKESYRYHNNDKYIFDGDVLKLANGTDITNPEPTDDEILGLAKPLTSQQYKKVLTTVNGLARTEFNDSVGFRFKDERSVMGRLDGLTPESWKLDANQKIPMYEKPLGELKPLTDEDKAFVLRALNKGNKPVLADGKQKFYRLDGKTIQTRTGSGGEWTDMTRDELARFVKSLGQVDFDKDRKVDGRVLKYMDSFFVSTSGSKVGESVGNFSVPPVSTCAHNVPCAKQGCYAMNAYRNKPTTRAAWGKNYVLLLEGRYQEFEDTIVKFINNRSNPIKLFRFNVSGDLFDRKYLDSIINIADRCGNGVQFWTYTKKYDMVKDIKKLPENLHIILSAWGMEFVPSVELQKRFPVAYLDDKTKETAKILDVIGDTLNESARPAPSRSNGRPEVVNVRFGTGENDVKPIIKRPKFYCPCTSYSDSGMKCEECQACFSKLWNGRKVAYNLVFKKH